MRDLSLASFPWGSIFLVDNCLIYGEDAMIYELSRAPLIDLSLPSAATGSLLLFFDLVSFHDILEICFKFEMVDVAYRLV